jgi:DNA-binding transcriptional regulator YiaG
MQQLTFSFRIPQDLPSEEWLPVVGYEDYYEVSNLGRVRTLKKRKGVQAGYILGKHQIPQGYCYVKLSVYGHPKTHFVHRLMMMAFNPIENHEDMDVNHRDGIRDNNTLDNLEWLSHAANIQYSRNVLKTMSHVGGKKGEVAPTSKLTDVSVREIRLLANQGVKQRVIAKMFGVSQVTIRCVIIRKSWKHIE